MTADRTAALEAAQRILSRSDPKGVWRDADMVALRLRILSKEADRMREALEALARPDGFPYLTVEEQLERRMAFARDALNPSEGTKT